MFRCLEVLWVFNLIFAKDIHKLALITSQSVNFYLSSVNYVCNENPFVFFFKKIKNCSEKAGIGIVENALMI
jgi:hypothetical protein